MSGERGAAVDRVVVVVPVHDEAEHLPACLEALAVARGRVPAGVDVRVVVVLDRCTDGSVEIAAARGDVEVVAVDAGTVGRARAVGADVLLAGATPSRVWLASTDADSVVPPTWLSHHLAVARSGAGMLLGTVEADPAGVGARRHAAWSAGYVRTDGHPHVHGANLGVRGDVYLASGGFPPLPAHEDVWLSRAVDAAGHRVVRSAAHAVTTSGRLRGRTPEGFATYLAALPADDAGVTS